MIRNNSSEIKMSFIGDICLKQKPFKLSKSLIFYLKDQDVVSCNFEGPLNFSNEIPIIKVGPCLSQNKKAITYLQQNNISFFNLSNNHIMDYGKESLGRTIEKLPPNSYCGAGLTREEAYKPLIKKINGLKIGFLSLAEWGFGASDDEQKYGFAWINHRCVNKLVEETKREVDVLIIQVHAGVEEIELPLPEWRDRYKELIDLGADLIVGHHPHVPQGWEEYKGKYIFYSLGNFYMENSGCMYEKSFILNVQICNELKISSKIIPIFRNRENIGTIKDKSYEYYLENLSKRIISKDYMEEVNNISKKLWADRYNYYYSSACNGLSINSKFKSGIRIIRNLLFGNDFDKVLLVHNLKIESHRYIVERYLNMILNKK